MQLFPWRLVVGVHAMLLFVVAVFTAMAVLEGGPAWSGEWGVELRALVLWGATK